MLGNVQRETLLESGQNSREPMATEIQDSTILERGQDIPFRQFDDERLAIDGQAGYCYSFNATAGRVWDLIATPMSFGAICAQIRREYAVDERTCILEVRSLLQGLCDAGLVRIRDVESR